jgi:SAM-dependent methyltransferase
MFRYATCDDLIQLKARYPEYCFSERDPGYSHAWGLKAMGRLFCVDKILKLQPNRILEVGGGCTAFFDEHFGAKTEYWMIDNGDFDPWNRFDELLKKRQNTHFVRGLLGEFNSQLPDSSFDLVFSISVLEHVSKELRSDVYRDMFRILRPGGVIVHSIDIPGAKKGREEFKHIAGAGFIIPDRPDLRISVRRREGKATLFEPLDIVFSGYFGIGRKDMWTKLKSITSHYPTILVLGIKPEGQHWIGHGAR